MDPELERHFCEIAAEFDKKYGLATIYGVPFDKDNIVHVKVLATLQQWECGGLVKEKK